MLTLALFVQLLDPMQANLERALRREADAQKSLTDTERWQAINAESSTEEAYLACMREQQAARKEPPACTQTLKEFKAAVIKAEVAYHGYAYRRSDVQQRISSIQMQGARILLGED